jgi:hypothetical protein
LQNAWKMLLLYRLGVQSHPATRIDGAGRRPESTWLWRLIPRDWPDMATQESDGAHNSESRGWQVSQVNQLQCRECQRNTADCFRNRSHFIANL